MSTNKSLISKETLVLHYHSGKSMADIAKQLHCSIHKVVYWMDKYNITRRTRSEASYLQQNPTGDPFSIKLELSKEETFLYGLGLGIYWGEGEKVSKHAIRVANTDPYVIKTFVLFLFNICGVEKRKLSYSIVCFNDSDPDKVKSYWANELKTDKENFGKIVQIPMQGKGTYKRKSQYGVCTATVSNIKLKTWILEEINKIKQSPTWLSGRASHW
jgi:hypothetical protein